MWHLDASDPRTYPRNTIETVVVQLRFHPILKIPGHLDGFQDRVRDRFPLFAEVTNQVFDIQPSGLVQTHLAREFRFQTVNKEMTLVLGTSAVAIEVHRHLDRRALLERMSLAVSALDAAYAPVLPTRLGLRYVNRIDRRRIGEELCREVGWEELLASGIPRPVGGLVDLDETQFWSEVTSVRPPGAMTLRLGLLRDPATDDLVFRLDTDRYAEGGFGLEDVESLLRGFADDAYALFESVAGPGLREWMSPTPAGSGEVDR